MLNHIAIEAAAVLWKAIRKENADVATDVLQGTGVLNNSIKFEVNTNQFADMTDEELNRFIMEGMREKEPNSMPPLNAKS